MSAEATFWAWSIGDITSSQKLVLLCLADCHNADNGQCNPSAMYVARRTEMNVKTVRKAISDLQNINLIDVQESNGGSNFYILHTTQIRVGQKRAYPKTGIPKNGKDPTQNWIEPYPKTDTESKKNLKENLQGSCDQKIQYSKIQHAWNEILGAELGHLRTITDQRKKFIKARISESPALAEVEKWAEYFDYISSIDFLMGRGHVNPNTGKPFKANFDWVINQTNMNKILEGRYE